LQLLRFFFRLRAIDLTIAIVTGALSGVSNVLFVAVVNNAIRPSATPAKSSAIVLVGLCLCAVLGRYTSDMVLVRLSQQVVYDLRMRLSREILMVPVRRLEMLGGHSIFATLTEDVTTLTNLALNFPNLCVNVAIFISVIGYLFYLAPGLAAIAIGMIMVGVTGHTLIRRSGIPHFRRSREAHGDLMKRFRALTDGVKEMKLNDYRREQFVSKLDGTAITLCKELISGSSSYIGAACWAQFVFFSLLTGLVLAGRYSSSYRLVPGLLSGAVLALMCVRGPVETIVGMFLNLARVQVSLNKIEQLGLSLGEETETVGENGLSASADECTGMEKADIEFCDVIHSYGCKDGDNFLLGPINLSFRKGEIIVVSGANGSGKTTFIKLLTGLYIPEAGEIRINGVPVSADNRENYRSLFTPIFADFYLDDFVARPPSEETDARGAMYLRQFQLDHKVTISNGKFSTLELSQGQRKRLALVAAHLEDRPIYVFDEWAADQDVSFRHIFYHQILPDLKKQGKTLFVISHDQHYFEVADRLIVLEEGKVWKDTQNEKQVSRAM
jgi:putative ATP-binding cassette transporter